MSEESISAYLEEMAKENASDLYLTVGFPPSLRINDKIKACSKTPLTESSIQQIMGEILTPEQITEFEADLELNISLYWQNRIRLRINIFKQQLHTGIVIRHIKTEVPNTKSLGLPKVYQELIMQRRGLVLVVGQSGSGKSTSLAAMIEHRNSNGSGHIITIEDPIEFIHTHKQCIITQRDVGIDTFSVAQALKNALRQRPDVVMIGEIRDANTMEQAINFAETGHLCVSTLHSNNANQAIERILNFFPQEKHHQILLNLALNLRGIISQRLVPNHAGGRSLATEIMLNAGLIRQLIEEGKIREIKDVIEKSQGVGMHTFDQALFALHTAGEISEETAVTEADNPSNLKLLFKQHHAHRTMMPSLSMLKNTPANPNTF